MASPRVLAFAGSARKGSLNRKLLAAAVTEVQAAGAEVTTVDLNDFVLPLYHGDLEEREGVPENARKLGALFQAHPGLLIASPEYNGQMTPLLKNTIDWCTRLDANPLEGRVAAVISASPGPYGGNRSLVLARQLLIKLGCFAIPAEVSLAHAQEAFDEQGKLKVERTTQGLRKLAAQLVAATRKAALPLLALMFAATAARAVEPADMAKLREVSDPQVSPDGAWVTYSLKTANLEKDKRPTNVWLASWDGTVDRALTFGDDHQGHARWSPDGKWIAFLSNRDDDNENDQIWLLPRAGGEPEKITTAPEGVDDFAWSPDSERLVYVAKDLDPREEKARKAEKDKKTVPPIVIDRYYFKQDIDGYQTTARSHLWLVGAQGHHAVRLTSGAHDEEMPAWAPDGRSIAYVSKRGDDPDRTEDWQIYAMAPEAKAPERQISISPTPVNHPDWFESAPAWSPDGSMLACLQGASVKLIEYASPTLSVVAASGGSPKPIAQGLDRYLKAPRFSPDGKWVYVMVLDDGTQHLDRYPAAGGAPEVVAGGWRTIDSYALGPKGEVAVRCSTPDRPYEIFAAEGGQLRAITHQNDAWLKTVTLGKTERIVFPSKDGTEVHGFVVHPATSPAAGAPAGLLRPHGGPQEQYSAEFSWESQIFAMHGYTVILPNPRGSIGRGDKYALGIYAAWGSVDVQDDLAAVDYAVSRGWADAGRLGVGGWSYGAMSTNYIIASTTRFKAATSGAGIANIAAGFGTDEYVRDYVHELGTPWEHPDVWLRISYPYYHADRIKTPTLFLGGDADYNVPLHNGEQMYQALRQLGIPTELVIYPGQFHGLTKASYLIDRNVRYLAWYKRWIP